MKGLLKQAYGGVAIEFALIAPVLVLIFAGLADLSTIVNTAMAAKNAAREGARAAAVSDPNWQQDAINYLSGSPNPLSGNAVTPLVSSVTIACGGPPWPSCSFPQNPGTPINVSVPVTVKITMPVIQKLLGATTLTVTGTASMEVSQ